MRELWRSIGFRRPGFATENGTLRVWSVGIAPLAQGSNQDAVMSI